MKGYIYTIEVLLALSLVLVMIVVIFSSTPEQPETSLVIIKQTGYDALHYLDQTGMLREAVNRDAYGEIAGNVTAMMPNNIKSDVAICTSTFCESYKIPVNRTIVAIDYYIAGYEQRYIQKKVRLWLWTRF